MPKRLLHLVVLLIASFTMMGAGTSAYEKAGHNLVCQCGCGQILLECNHVGCPVSPKMIDELHAQVASGLPLTGIYNFFVAKYGPIVLAAPMRGGFDNVAWIVPVTVFLLGVIAVIVLLRLWRRRHRLHVQAVGGPAVSSSESDDLRERIRRDTTYE